MDFRDFNRSGSKRLFWDLRDFLLATGITEDNKKNFELQHFELIIGMG